MRRYCIQLYDLQGLKILETICEAESALIATVLTVPSIFNTNIPELSEVETFEEAVNILENNNIKLEVFRI